LENWIASVDTEETEFSAAIVARHANIRKTSFTPFFRSKSGDLAQ
jgi:hypothetical protein